MPEHIRYAASVSWSRHADGKKEPAMARKEARASSRPSREDDEMDWGPYLVATAEPPEDSSAQVFADALRYLTAVDLPRSWFTLNRDQYDLLPPAQLPTDTRPAARRPSR